jgi:hypothetical protein
LSEWSRKRTPGGNVATRIQRRCAAAVGLVATLSFSHGVVADVSPALIGFSPHVNTIEKATLMKLYGH